MKIAIDISQIVYETGVSHYVKNIVKNLLLFDKSNKYILFAGTFRQKKHIESFANTLSGNFDLKIFPIPPVISSKIWNSMHILPVENFIGQVDVLHTSDWTEPPSAAFKVTTVHDLAPILHPDLFPRDKVRDIVNTHKLKLSWVKSETQRIIVPSNITKEDLIRIGFDHEKIRVISEAVSGEFKKVDAKTIENLKRRYKISGRYLLAVGMDIRKNPQRIINAFNLARAGQDLKLIFVGTQKYSEVFESRNVRVVGRIPTHDLPAFYSGAEALVYPSLYEGFGLPILEAFACGCPVVTTSDSSMSEVAGEAAVLVDPYSVDSIADGIRRVLRAKKGFSEKGYKRASEFSWSEAAKKTLEVYSESGL